MKVQDLAIIFIIIIIPISLVISIYTQYQIQTVNTQTLYDGSKMLVIKTYNPNSKNAGISQTIHFTKESAKQLIDILKRELNI